MNQPITHVSDTTVWVAMYRALESERPDALFQDPLARRLVRPMFEESVHLKRSMPLARFWLWLGKFSSAKRREEFRRMSGMVRLGRA